MTLVLLLTCTDPGEDTQRPGDTAPEDTGDSASPDTGEDTDSDTGDGPALLFSEDLEGFAVGDPVHGTSPWICCGDACTATVTDDPVHGGQRALDLDEHAWGVGVEHTGLSEPFSLEVAFYDPMEKGWGSQATLRFQTAEQDWSGDVGSFGFHNDGSETHYLFSNWDGGGTPIARRSVGWHTVRFEVDYVGNESRITTTVDDGDPFVDGGGQAGLITKLCTGDFGGNAVLDDLEAWSVGGSGDSGDSGEDTAPVEGWLEDFESHAAGTEVADLEDWSCCGSPCDAVVSEQQALSGTQSLNLRESNHVGLERAELPGATDLSIGVYDRGWDGSTFYVELRGDGPGELLKIGWNADGAGGASQCRTRWCVFGEEDLRVVGPQRASHGGAWETVTAALRPDEETVEVCIGAWCSEPLELSGSVDQLCLYDNEAGTYVDDIQLVDPAE